MTSRNPPLLRRIIFLVSVLYKATLVIDSLETDGVLGSLVGVDPPLGVGVGSLPEVGRSTPSQFPRVEKIEGSSTRDATTQGLLSQPNAEDAP
jgi:hypothetical protein